MRALKAVLGVTAIVALAFVSCGWVLTRHIPMAPGQVAIGPQTKIFLNYVQKELGLSERDAIAFMHKASEENGGQRIIDSFEIPVGAQVDFIEVDGKKGGRETVRYLGNGRALPASSNEGIAFWRIFERAARRNGWDSALRAMTDLRRRGLMVVPAWFGGGTRIVETAASTASAGTGAANVRVAIILARFPAWIDKAPYSDGNGQRGSGDRYYTFDPDGRQRHVDPKVDGRSSTWPGSHDWYLDSPGGVMDSTGEPRGTKAQWNDLHPDRTPNVLDGPTAPKARDYWYRRIFDLNFAGDPIRGDVGDPSGKKWPGSLTNYYWDNSHGSVRIQGQPTDIYGWFESHHILDRLAYPQGTNPVYMIQPGTPLIRPSEDIIAYDDDVNRPILRASLTADKLTVLYKNELSATPWPQLEVYQRDINGTTTGDQSGWATLQIANEGATRAIMDPYDARRWTYVRQNWVYTDAGDTTKTRTFTPWSGRDWRVTYSGYTWESGQPKYKPQEQGCGELPDTLFTRDDVALQLGPGTTAVGAQNPPDTTGNRLKSFDYYCHDHFLNTSRGPYQLEALYHGIYRDDIGGDSENANYIRARPYPFDCGLPTGQGGSDRMQMGFFNFSGNNNDGDDGNRNHSAVGMRADVDKVMRDAGVTVAGYDRIVYIFADKGIEESGEVEEGSLVEKWGSIIAHAGGNMVTVGEDVGLGTFAHELGHTFGMGDLYDLDFYTNNESPPPNPPYFECSAMGPYSLMAHGGRVDAYHKIKLKWLSGDKVVALQTDRPNAEIPAVEGVLREPIVYKLPANPYYIVGGEAPSSWQEYYLVEYRNANYYGDTSPRGVYIYHIDERGVGQNVEGLLSVSIVEADANDHLQVLPKPQEPELGDPFGGPPDMKDANSNFCQWNFRLDDWLLNREKIDPAPRAYSHGLFNTHGIDKRPQKIGDTEADTFTRVMNIRVSGAMAYADIYVRPREIVPAGFDAWADRIDADGTPDKVAWQGLKNVPVMRLVLKNERNTGPGDCQHMSMGPVTIERLRVLESGSSPKDEDVTLVKVWADTDGDLQFDEMKDTLLASASVKEQEAILQDLNYEVPLGEERNLFVTYDISETAQVNPKITLGADLPEPRYIWPKAPGTVQERVRTEEQFRWGPSNFPIYSSVGEVLDATDTLLISSSSLAPGAVAPNDQQVPVLRLLMSVDHDRAIVRRLRFKCRPDASPGVDHTPSMPQKDVQLAELWIDKNENGVADSDEKLEEAVFSDATTLLFDNIKDPNDPDGMKVGLPIEAGKTLHLLVTFNIAKNVDLTDGAHWLQLELPQWKDDKGTADPSDDVYYVELVDEDGPENTLYGDPSQPEKAWSTSDSGHTVIVAGQDVVDEGGAPWKSDDFAVRPPGAPTLTFDPATDPATGLMPSSRRGNKSQVFKFTVKYTSPAGMMPKYVKLVYRHQDAAAGQPDSVVAMTQVDPADTDVTDGKDYEVQLTGNAAFPQWGLYRFYFMANDGFSNVWWYDPDGPDGGSREGSYSDRGPRDKATDESLDEWLVGPMLGTDSQLRQTNAAWVQATEYEEGRSLDPATAARIYLELNEPDENDPAQVDTVEVLVESLEDGDQETVTLTETGANTGIFRGSLPTIGRAGESEDGWLNAMAGNPSTGTTRETIQATYTDKDDSTWPYPQIDRSQVQAQIKDTVAPAKVQQAAPAPALVLVSGPQGRTIDVDWSFYDEDGQIDIAPDGGYRVYVEETDFTNVAGLTEVNATKVEPGTQTYTIANLPDGTPLTPGRKYYVAVVAFDEIPNQDNVVRTTAITTTDTQPPVVVSQSPAPDETEVAVGRRTITVQVQDTGVGIDLPDTPADPNPVVEMSVSVNGTPVNGTRTLTPATGAPTQEPVTIEWTSTSTRPWKWNDVVQVHLVVRDAADNRLTLDWSFYATVDQDAPSIATRTPENGSVEVPLDQVISVQLQDAVSGVDWSTFTFEVEVRNRGTVTQPRVRVDSWVQPQPATGRDANDQVVTFDPKDVPANQYPELANGWTWNDVVRVWVYVKDRAGNVLEDDWTFNVLADLTPPAVDMASLAPAKDATQVGFAEPVAFDISDNLSGVDEQTLQVELRIMNRGSTRQAWTDITDDAGFSVIWTPDFTRGSVSFEPSQDWQWNDVVSVRVRATDRAGNAMSNWSVWSFSVLADTDDLAIIPVSPLDEATGVERSTNIVFRVVDGQEDDQAGVDKNRITLKVTVNGQTIQAPLQIEGYEYDYQCTYDPAQDFNYGDLVQCVAEAYDLAGNMRTLTWSFRIVGDVTAPTVTPVTPLANDTGVRIDANVVVSLTDTETGVNSDSVQVEVLVGGTAVPGTLTKREAAGSVTVTATFDPQDLLPYETDVTVRVQAADNAGNKVTPPFEYQFRTQNAPRYMIVGRVTNASGVPIPAVNVALSGDVQKTVQTDGNGYFRFDGLLAGTYTVKVLLGGWTFTPEERQVNLQANADNVDFVGREQTFQMSGTVATADGKPLAGVSIQVNALTVTTDAQGVWRMAGLTIGEYTITPTFASYRFEPASRTVRITEATVPGDLTNLDFRAIPFSFSIAGLVTDYQGNRMDAVRLTCDGRTAVTNETGRYEIGGVPTGTVQVRAEKEGWSFIWQDAQGVWHRGDQPVAVPPNQTAINFVGYRAFRKAFSTGMYMLGVPATPYDAAASSVFGTEAVARWDPVASPAGYVTPRLRPDSELLQVKPGRGFFVRFAANTDLEVIGVPTDPNSPVNLGLSMGWNMLGNPYDAVLSFASIKTTSGTLRPFGYVYDPVRRSYLLVSDTPGVGVERSYMLPWEGIWLRALSTASVQISQPTRTAEVEKAEALQLDLGPKGWWLPVAARVGERYDECCAVGVRSTGAALSLEKPPAMPDAVDVSVQAADGTRLSRSVQVGTKTKHEWDIVVSTDVASAEVAVSLPDLSRVPHDMTVTLTDPATGKSLYARTMSTYRFQVGDSGGSRVLRLTVEPRTTAGLVVSAASARAQGSRVVVSYSVSCACRVQARVLNIAGRPVRVLASDSVASAGVNTFAWDGRNASGSVAPPGLYLVEIEAVAENGQRAKAVTQVRYGPGR